MAEHEVTIEGHVDGLNDAVQEAFVKFLARLASQELLGASSMKLNYIRVNFSVSYATDGDDIAREEMERLFNSPLNRLKLTAAASVNGQVVSSITDGKGETWPRYYGIDEDGFEVPKAVLDVMPDYLEGTSVVEGKRRPPFKD